LFEHCNDFLVFSNYVASQLAAAGCPAEKITLLRMGIDLEKYAGPVARESSGKTRFLINSPLEEAHGIHFAIEAFNRLVREEPDLELVIIGDGAQKSNLIDQIIELKLARKIKLIPLIRPAEILNNLQKADVFLYPRITGPEGQCESVPVAIIQAAACGLPVIATEHGGIPEVVQHQQTGLLVPEKDVDSLYESMKKLHLDKRLTLKLGAEGLALVQADYDIKKISGQLQNIYQRILEKKQPYQYKLQEQVAQKSLVFRSIPLIDFLYRLFYLHETYPDSEIHVLTSPASHELCAAHPLVREVVPFTGKRFSPFHLSSELKKKLGGYRFDKIIVPVNSSDGTGFENVLAMAKLLPAKKKLGLGIENRWFDIGWWSLVKLKFSRDFWQVVRTNALVIIPAAVAIVFLFFVYLVLKVVKMFKKPVRKSLTDPE